MLEHVVKVLRRGKGGPLECVLEWEDLSDCWWAGEEHQRLSELEGHVERWCLDWSVMAGLMVLP